MALLILVSLDHALLGVIVDLEERTLIKLDRMVANNEWMDLFPDAKVQYRSMLTFDRCMLILYPKSNSLARQ